MYKEKQVTAIVVAAGRGTRFGGDLPKQFLKIEGKTVLEKAIDAFESHTCVDNIIVVTGEDFLVMCRDLCSKFRKVREILPGGKERQDSVREGLNKVNDGLVLVHDGARPFVSAEIIDSVLKEAYNQGAAVPCIAIKDTVRQADEGLEGPSRTLDRSTLFGVQTPQGFEVDILKSAFEDAYRHGYYGTDDAGLVERSGSRWHWHRAVMPI